MRSTIDAFFIAGFASAVAVGIYGFFSRLTEMGQDILPVRLFDNVVQPMLFSTRRDEAERRISRYFTFLLNKNLAVQLPVFVYVLSYHRDLVGPLSTGTFTADSWMLPVLIGFATLNVVADPASTVAQYEERAGILLISKVLAVYNTAAMAVLIPFLGIYGAALASGSAQTMTNLFVWWHVRRRAVWLNGSAAAGYGLLLWGVTTALYMAERGLLPLPALAHLAIGALIVAAAALLHLRGPALADRDRELLASVLPQWGAAAMRWLGLAAVKS